MKPSPFTYHAPERLDEVTALFAEHGDAIKPLAGGQSLVPLLSLRLAAFEHLVDLNVVEGLDRIERIGSSLRIGAIVRQAAAEHDAQVAATVPLLTAALPHIGHFQIRNRGTVGGSIAHADPASELPAVALALDATIQAAGQHGTRTIAAADFFQSTWQSSLADDEILTAVDFPIWTGHCGFAVEEVARRHGDFALVGTAVGVQTDEDGKVTKASIALFGVGSTAVRSADAEAALLAGASAEEAGRIAAEGISPTSDIHASGAYRKQVAAVVIRRALTTALAKAGK